MFFLFLFCCHFLSILVEQRNTENPKPRKDKRKKSERENCIIVWHVYRNNNKDIDFCSIVLFLWFFAFSLLCLLFFLCFLLKFSLCIYFCGKFSDILMYDALGFYSRVIFFIMVIWFDFFLWFYIFFTAFFVVVIQKKEKKENGKRSLRWKAFILKFIRMKLNHNHICRNYIIYCGQKE